MTSVRFDEIDGAGHRPRWFPRLWKYFLQRQEMRAERVIKQHAHLIPEYRMGFAFPDATVARTASATWSAVLHGTTCEAGFCTSGPPVGASPFSR